MLSLKHVDYFQKSHGIAVIFDVTNKDSFHKIEDYWLEQVKENAPPNVTTMLIGNKCDLSETREVLQEEGEALANKFGFKYFETSAKNGINVTESFDSLIEQCVSDLEKRIEEETIKLRQRNTIPEEREESSCLQSLKNIFKGFRE
eukprot:TRINITY_DN1253_c0_g2_i16.p1 TRINITY_DN1253_c0_g2~~TRINITY_DN1253_c0_g2_i16.p1  ORF type:complete len:146 (-),score=15.42 TRINITY_DN1253_c0_g2_i16:126-563(-)